MNKYFELRVMYVGRMKIKSQKLKLHKAKLVYSKVITSTSIEVQYSFITVLQASLSESSADNWSASSRNWSSRTWKKFKRDPHAMEALNLKLSTNFPITPDLYRKYIHNNWNYSYLVRLNSTSKFSRVKLENTFTTMYFFSFYSMNCSYFLYT